MRTILPTLLTYGLSCPQYLCNVFSKLPICSQHIMWPLRWPQESVSSSGIWWCEHTFENALIRSWQKAQTQAEVTTRSLQRYYTTSTCFEHSHCDCSASPPQVDTKCENSTKPNQLWQANLTKSTSVSKRCRVPPENSPLESLLWQTVWEIGFANLALEGEHWDVNNEKLAPGTPDSSSRELALERHLWEQKQFRLVCIYCEILAMHPHSNMFSLQIIKNFGIFF